MLCETTARGFVSCCTRTIAFVHCYSILQWARDWFEGEFSQTPSAANAYIRQADYIASLAAQPAVRLDTLKRVHGACCPMVFLVFDGLLNVHGGLLQIESALVTDKPVSLPECIQWARRQ